MPNDIHYPVSIKPSETPYVCLVDAEHRPFAGGILVEDARVMVEALNLYLAPKSKRKSEKVQQEEVLRRSDLTAQIVDRQDIEYGHFDSLPMGQHVARVKKHEHS